MPRGRMIALYGVNGIGKTTQAELLVAFLRAQGKPQVSRLKYPVYDLEPEGPFLYQYLRDADFRASHPQTTEELQLKYADNRRRYQPKLQARLAAGEWIVAEDYVGTGIAWGLAWGGDFDSLEKMNAGLSQPDISILMYGERFETAIEAGHRNETEGERIRICNTFLRLLGERSGWERIDANQSREAVAAAINHVIKTRV